MKVAMDRVKEPSTWVAVGALVAVFGVDIAPEQWEMVAQGIGAVIIIVGAIMKERGSE